MDIQEMIDQEILNSMRDLAWKQIYRFAQKWNLATICIAVPSAVKEQLERDFRAAHPDLDFEKEWSKCLDEVADDRFDPLVGTLAEVVGRADKKNRAVQRAKEICESDGEALAKYYEEKWDYDKIQEIAQEKR